MNETEQEALIGDPIAVIRVVSALRRYRMATEKLLSQQYRDGECDAVALNSFMIECEEIEDMLAGTGDNWKGDYHDCI